MPISSPEQAQFIVDLRQRIQANRDAGRPEYEGIEREDLQQVINILRSNRAVAGSKARSNTSKSKEPIAGFNDDELDSLFR